MTKKDSGFTLIELLVVMATIGIIAAIAIPQFSEFKGGSFDSRAVYDLRNAAVAEEYYFMDNNMYATCDEAAECERVLPGFVASEGIELAMSDEGSFFTGNSRHPFGSTPEFRWDSSAGGLQ